MDHEGHRVARYLADHGVAALVLKYRLAHQAGSSYTVEGHALADVQRAIRVVRSRASAWGIDPQRIGVMGFSAGGELAELAGTRFDAGAPGAADALERLSSRPDFQALIYPGLRQELPLSAATPPAFLLCGADDQPYISQGLAELYLAMRRAGVRAELHIYDGVGHGFGLRAENAGPSAAWPERFLDWLAQQGMMTRRPAAQGH
jgi:endo-1,4-beta-xylanase